MADVTIDLVKAHLRQLRLPTMGREFERLARDAAATNQNYFEFLLRLTETELATRAANAVTMRIKNAEFPVLKDLDTYDFSALPQLSKPKVLELRDASGLNINIIAVLSGATELVKLTSRLHWPSRLSPGVAGAVFHRGRTGDRVGEGAEAVHARPYPRPTGPTSSLGL